MICNSPRWYPATAERNPSPGGGKAAAAALPPDVGSHHTLMALCRRSRPQRDQRGVDVAVHVPVVDLQNVLWSGGHLADGSSSAVAAATTVAWMGGARSYTSYRGVPPLQSLVNSALLGADVLVRKCFWSVTWTGALSAITVTVVLRMEGHRRSSWRTRSQDFDKLLCLRQKPGRRLQRRLAFFEDNIFMATTPFRASYSRPIHFGVANEPVATSGRHAGDRRRQRESAGRNAHGSLLL